MSFIERALNQTKNVARREQPTEPVVVSEGQVAPASPGQAMQHGMASQSGISQIACRADLRVRIDISRLRAAGVLAPEDEEHRVAEEYRAIKRLLLRSMAENQSSIRPNLVIVTSAVPGEGKTFTAINLALSLARERDREVVLIDGDVAKRHITQLLELDDEEGLLDLGGIEGRDFEHAVLKTDIPSLYVLPAGNENVEATEILHSDRIALLLHSLASDRRRILLIDSPPLLATSEAGVLGQLAGQIIMIVKASDTPREIVQRAIEMIPDEKPIGLVLNQVLSPPERAYGYYYGSYRYAGRDAARSAEGTIPAAPGGG